MHTNLFSAGAKAVFTGLMCAGLLMACHKDNNNKPTPGPDPIDTTTTSTAIPAKEAEDSLKYLMYQIMQVSYADGGRNSAAGLPTYYWYGQVPKLNPLDSKYANADSLLSQMKTYAINTTATPNAPYDRYSFLDRNGTLTNKLMNGVSAQNFAAATGDFGFDYGISVDQSGKAHLFVLYADKNSPAGLKGVTRGWEITSVNGNSNIQNTTAFLKSTYDAIFNSSSVTLGFKRTDNSTTTETLNTTSYNINPVLFDTVFTVKGENVGYFSMYTFSSVTNSDGQPTYTKTALDQTFDKFKTKGITSLIVDLRYNGGGAITTAEYLDAAIAPASAAGQVMYTYLYNDKLMQNLAATELTSLVNFPAGTGGLSLKNVFFITTGNTASASELTLNNLRPYLRDKLKLVGEKTYGKPVGFIDFNISIYDKAHKQQYLADLYAINFETVNKEGIGKYYNGIDVDAAAVDYVNVPWGNADDDNLQKIFSYLNTGAFARANARLSTAEAANLRTVVPNAKPMHGFNGMVDFKHRTRLK
ncbi:S41 family peptidase [Chitinophaga sp. MM2321]|uniref:S41 family peptidase n=1 Tax=Chitinophaga sp. MM2321 TaxID=3137178 RepID=UPI0032D57C3E